MAFTGGYLAEFTDAAAIFGAIAASYVLLKLSWALWSVLKAFILAKPLGLSANLRQMGQWAVVTGATDGIGKAYAQELAKLGLDIVLISRNPEKLSRVAAEIESNSGVSTKCITIDFTDEIEIYEKIRAEIEGLDIGVLVNNVGLVHFKLSFYDKMAERTIRDTIKLNMIPVVEMTRIILPRMVAKGRGAIINIASAAGLRPTPVVTLYSATKTFINFLSQATQIEYRSKGIIVQSVIPFYVSTKMSSESRSSLLSPSASSYVQSALGTVGVEEVTFGCLSHTLQAWFMLLLPFSLQQKLSMYATGGNKLEKEKM